MYDRTINRIIVCITIAIASVFFWVYGLRSNVLHGDALGYYLYLPATFIYHNLENTDQIPADKKIGPGIYGDIVKTKENKTPKGYTLNQYTYGVAFMEMPFFLIAHTYELARGLPANGYSDTYVYLLKISALFYGLLGLLLVYRVLKKYFTPTQSLLGVAIIFLGTNLFWFSVLQAGMSHVPLFFLYSLLIWLTIKMHEEPKTSLFIVTGFVTGLIIIIRPTDILCILIPLLYNIYSIKTLREKAQLIKNNGKNILAVIAASIIPILPQLLYWKAITGHYIFYSYGQQSFDWHHPMIKEGLFSFSNGWLPYCPVMIFSLVGMLMLNHIKRWVLSIWLILPAYVYVIYCWYCYNYINGLGSRPMIHMYPLLAIPLTALICLFAKQKLWLRYIFGILCAFFICVNLSYSMLQTKRMLLSENSSAEFNFQMLFRTKFRYNDLVVKDLIELQPDSNKLQKIGTIACGNYEDSLSPHYVHDPANGSKYVYHMTADEEYQQPSEIVYNKKKYKDAKWFKCSGRFMCTTGSPGMYHQHYIRLVVLNKVLEKTFTIDNKIGNWRDTTEKDITYDHCETNRWGYVYFFTEIPKNLKDGESIYLFVWNRSQNDIYIDDLCIEAYK